MLRIAFIYAKNVNPNASGVLNIDSFTKENFISKQMMTDNEMYWNVNQVVQNQIVEHKKSHSKNRIGRSAQASSHK